MAFKVTIYYSSFRQIWTESYINTGSWVPPVAPADPNLLSIVSLVNARTALLGAFTVLTAVRVSQFPANRLVTTLDLSIFTQQNAQVGIINVLNLNPFISEIPNVSVVLKMGTPIGFKLIYVAGIPQGVIENVQGGPGRLNPTGVQGWADALGKFISVLIGGPWGCRSQGGTVLIQAASQPVQGTQTPPMIGIPLGAPSTLTPGQQVLLRGWRRINPRSPGLSGVFTVGQVVQGTPVGGSTVYLLNTAAVSPTNFKGVGKIGLINAIFERFVTGAYDTVTTRKRGVRALGPLGRFSRIR